jgi:HEAT repeat protein
MRGAILSMLLISATAWAGRGGSTGAIEAAVASGSVDAIVAEIERAEFLACLSCIAPVRALVDHPSARVRDAAGWWLTRRGVRTQVLADMTARLAAQDPLAARNAADVLAAMKDPGALAPLGAYLAHPLDEDSGRAAARALGLMGNPAALPALQGALASPLAGVRQSAAAAIRDLRAPVGARFASDAAALLPLFNDGDAGVRREAIFTAAYLMDHAAVAPLVLVVAGDTSPQVRKAAAWALGEIGDAQGRAALAAAQSDSDPFVRSIASAALLRLK